MQQNKNSKHFFKILKKIEMNKIFFLLVHHSCVCVCGYPVRFEFKKFQRKSRPTFSPVMMMMKMIMIKIAIMVRRSSSSSYQNDVCVCVLCEEIKKKKNTTIKNRIAWRFFFLLLPYVEDDDDDVIRENGNVLVVDARAPSLFLMIVYLFIYFFCSI